MRLFIRIQDGQPFEHPITEDNMKQAFPEIDLDNLPSSLAEFIRVPAPVVGPYEKNLRVQYELGQDGKYKDAWYKDPMTNEERLAKQEEVKATWTQNGGHASWLFDEETCSFYAPIPIPDDGNNYIWRESDQTWVYFPQQPIGEGWAFNKDTGTWVKI